MYYVYILECGDGSLYTGITTDLERRFAQHRQGIGASYTRSRRVNKMVHSETAPNRALAQKREAQIKAWSRKEKLTFIQTAKARGRLRQRSKSAKHQSD